MRSKCIGLLIVLPILFLAAPGMCQAGGGREKIISRGGYDAVAAKIRKTGKARVIIRVDTEFRPMADAASEEAIQQMKRITSAQDTLLSQLAKHNVRGLHKYRYIPYLVAEVDEKALQALLDSPLAVTVQEDVRFSPHLDVSVPRIGSPAAWSAAFKGEGVVVAVIDTGVDSTHPLLSGSVISEACYSTTDATNNDLSLCPKGVTESISAGSAMPYGGNCPPGYCDHGTHVSGIVAGRDGVSGSPGAGVAPRAGIIAIQVFTRSDDPAYCYPDASCISAYDSDIMKGLERVYALRTTYNIAAVNMSLGSPPDSTDCDAQAMKTSIDNLKAAGIATVISSGNDGSCGSLSFPACISSAVSVGATDDNDAVASFSNSATSMTLLAPGTTISSSVPGGAYDRWDGTSMAAPHVAGALALVKEAKPGATVDQLLNAFVSTGTAVTDIGKCGTVTKKRLNINQALNFLGVSTPPAVTSTLPAGDAGGLFISTPVMALFSEPMDAATFSNAIFTIDNGATGTVSYDAAKQTATFSPSAYLSPDTTYTATLTAGVRDLAGSLPTAAKVWKFTTGPAASSYNVLVNGDFEARHFGWTESNTGGHATIIHAPGYGHNGSNWYLWAGSDAAITSSTYQDFAIPAAATNACLQFWHRITTYLSSDLPVDTMAARIEDPSTGEVLKTLQVFSNLDQTADWMQTGQYDLTAYKGRRLRLRFLVKTTNGSGTYFRVDDAAVTVTMPNPLLTVSLAGTGSGVVTATPSGTACNTGCTASFSPGTPVTLSASPDMYSLFAGWSGVCTGTANCAFAINADTGVTATFDKDTAHSVRIDGATPTYYSSIHGAYASADVDDIIKAWGTDFIESPGLNLGKAVTIKGGFDDTYKANAGFSIMHGTLTIGTGSVVVERLAIQ